MKQPGNVKMPRQGNRLVDMSQLLEILDLEKIEEGVFRGASPDVGWQRVFGGLVISQALVAASRTMSEGRFAHSLHSYFLRPGDPALPILYEVENIRDGASFATRRVVAIQHGKPIFSLSASFQVDEPGLAHQMPMPDVPQPEDLPDAKMLYETYLQDAPEHVRAYWLRERPVEVRPVAMTHYVSKEALAPVQHIWIRPNGAVGPGRDLQSAVLAYLSDMTLLDTALFPHGLSVFDKSIQAASLDHAMWFHAADPLDDWLLYTQDSPFSGGARGLSRGAIYNRSGRLIASTAQEGLIRKRADD
jgi:acyl-CoA thioesterase-2